MAKTFNDVITIMRRIIGENDGNDPDATNGILIDYVANFYKLIMGQEIKSHDLYTWFEFDTVIDQETYVFKDQGFTNILPPVYVIDAQNNSTQAAWFQDPESFYNRVAVKDDNENSGRPWALLFFNDEIILRNKADAVYTIKMRAYKELSMPSLNGVLDGTANIDQDYYLRFLAYGASLDYLADFGNLENYAQIEPVYKRYRNLVMMRTAKQATTQRARQAL